MAGQSGISEPTLPERQTLTTVLRFLKKKNLKDTEEMLRKELGVHSDMELDEFNSLGGVQHSRETEPSKYDESYTSPYPILASRPPPLTKAANTPAPFPSSPPLDLSNNSCPTSAFQPGGLPVPMAAAASPLSPPRLSPSSHYAGTVGIDKGSPDEVGVTEERTAAKSSLVFDRACPNLQPILTLPATSGGASGSMLSMPPFLYQLAASPHHYQGGLVSTAATAASALTHHHPMIASICTLHPSGLVSTSAFPFGSPMAAYSVLVGTSSSKKSPPPPTVEDDEARPTSTSSPVSAVAQSPKMEAPVVSSTQPHLHDGNSASRPFSLKGSAQVLASIPPEEYTPAFVELKQFAEEFKTRRIRLGYTQGAVGQSLADRGFSNFAQSTISRFEQLQLSPTNAAAIKQILEKWLLEAESPVSSNSCNGRDAAGTNNCRKRKKRAVFTSQTKALLENHFAVNPRPNRATIEMLSGKLDLLPEEIRVWFCNKRQKAKQSGSEDGANATTPSSNSEIQWGYNKVWSTSSSVGSVGSRSASPSQDVRCGGSSPSPKTSFTIEELSKSSVVATLSGSSRTPSPSLSSPPLVFSPYNVSPTLASMTSSQGSYPPLSFFVPKLVVAPPATQAL